MNNTENPKSKQFGSEYIFLPDATHGAVRFLTTEQLKSTGTKGIVVNTLHLMINPGMEKMSVLGGIPSLMNWDGWSLSDSGGFQIFSLIHSKKWRGKITNDGATFKAPIDGKEHILTPETSIDIQMAINSDILVALDDCRSAEISREDAEKSVDYTIKWAKRAKEHFENKFGGTAKTGKLLSAVVQGANYLDLRAKCAEELVKIGFDGYNFGGYVVNSKGELTVEEMKVVTQSTPDDKFKYAMGVGKPSDIFECAKIGYKVFDTVLVTRNARHGTLYSLDKIEDDSVLRIGNSQYIYDKSPVDSYCDCELCRNYSRAYISYLFRIDESAGKILSTLHNLRFYQRLITAMNKHQDKISELNFREFLELMKS